jgi:hypothetical protein
MICTNRPTEVQVKKHLTAEEHAMRRAEMARRRKNLSEKRNEEEKVLLSHSLSRSLLTSTRWKRSTSSSKSKPPKPMLVAEISTPYPEMPHPIPRARKPILFSFVLSATKMGTALVCRRSGSRGLLELSLLVVRRLGWGES